MIPNDIRERNAILTYLKKKSSRPVSFGEIADSLHIRKKEFRSLKRNLQTLVKSGEIHRTKKGHYGVAEEMNLVTGGFDAHRDGYGFVLMEKRGEKDLFIPPRKTMGAMSGDKVVARVESSVRMEGTIIKILERGKSKVLGELVKEKNIYYVKPKRKNIPFYIFINPENLGGAKDGDMVSVEITSYPSGAKPPEGKVLKVFPALEDASQEVDLIIEEYSLPKRFPPAVLAEAKSLTDIKQLRKRVDCRDLLTVTIDGETAKDFDDAISINKTDRGYTLYVHIADVSHYVPWDSVLDIEARRRGTSVYFPGSVIPMLPERISNNLCSLVPKQDRPTFTVEMHFDRSGAMVDKSFYPSLIHSNERMTYTKVKKILVDHDAAERQKYDYLLHSFELMEELSLILRKERSGRGSLDFDLPEPEILLDLQGRPESIIKSERNMAHMLIEDFMVTANEAVGSHLEKIGVPSLYRVHDKPDSAKLDELRPIFKAFGLKVSKTGPKVFHSVLNQAKGTEEESLLNILLLRSLKQANYATENIGHFGLASTCYTHFTSPIRRYPDLVVHRILKDSLGSNKLSKSKIEYLEKILPDIANSSSNTERTADEVERDIVNAMKVWFMKDKVGDEYRGLVTNMNPHGLKIQLKDFFVEGFLHVSSLADDYYRFEEENYRLIGRRSKKTFTVGQELTVRIDRVNIEERDIVFGLVK